MIECMIYVQNFQNILNDGASRLVCEDQIRLTKHPRDSGSSTAAAVSMPLVDIYATSDWNTPSFPFSLTLAILSVAPTSVMPLP